MERTARLKAYAKLNLGLRVLYRRPDGYHELRTVFQTISLADALEISFEPSRSLSIAIEGAPEIADNLAERAARLAMETAGKTGAVRLRLRKRIPSGAGLGGGSSDAAAVLLALPVLGGFTIPIDRLLDLAAQLGSDVPFFLYGGAALGLGRGEELYPLPDFPAQQALLIASDVHSSTADAYRDLSATLSAPNEAVSIGGRSEVARSAAAQRNLSAIPAAPSEPATPTRNAIAHPDLPATIFAPHSLTKVGLQNKLSSFQRGVWGNVPGIDKSSIINDFEEVVFARYPVLREVREKLIRSGATCVAMTGSGSAIFGIFDNPGKLERARLAWNRPGERAFSVSFVSRARYRAAWRRAL
ncbi:MAG TPA: 4-(cytidine 5'-diphospho)-2-C-methyl-D-erythritol kinase, partial [Bryobacteraceae bacterium]|nr:4-(cytidine 5'-diphospho)-2-C-methyl-D-erythritol kinase [Bryobacteraceae bacterium]